MEIIETKRVDSTVSYDEWENHMTSYDVTGRHLPWLFDIKVANFLKPVTAAYLIEPVGVYLEEIIDPVTRKIQFNELAAFKKMLEDVGKKIVIYTLFWVPCMPVFDFPTQTVIEEPPSKISGGNFWYIRYAEV